MQDYLQARDACEAHIHAALEALVQALGSNETAYRYPDERQAARAAQLAIAARELAAAQAANEGAMQAGPGD